jgi:hypothetical protein
MELEIMKSMPFFLALLVPPLAIASVFAQSANRITQKDAQAMNHDKEYGNPNPKAPPELSQFAFIIGKWRCDARLKGEDGTWQPYQATSLDQGKTWAEFMVIEAHRTK